MLLQNYVEFLLIKHKLSPFPNRKYSFSVYLVFYFITIKSL